MSDITTELPEILAAVERPGDFYASDTLKFYPPTIEVEGVGPVALPLLPIQAQQLIEAAEQAPYGRGEKTLLDTEVRRSWQIDASKVNIQGGNWDEIMADIISQISTTLGIDGKVVAQLYKLLIYDEGSFFVEHRDTEKAPGMFASLVISLPSNFEGGELVIRHGDQSIDLALQTPEPSELAFAAFYADCVHEIKPITSGCRITLVYNLLRKGKRRPPKPPNYHAETERVVAQLHDWIRLDGIEETPEKIIIPLEFAYTSAELGFNTLKGADGAVASVLRSAAEQTDCEIHLALLTIEESGSAEYHGYYGGRSSWDDFDDDDDDAENYEIVEVFDRITTLSEWRRPDSGKALLSVHPFSEIELCPPDLFDDLEPDEQHFSEAAGNEGASFERSYHRAALVLWPQAWQLEVLNQAGLNTTLPYLNDAIGRWVDSGEAKNSALWQQAHQLADHMLLTWPKSHNHWYHYEANDDSHAGQMLTLLAHGKYTDHIETFLSTISGEGNYTQADNIAIIKAIRLLPAQRRIELLEKIISHNSEKALSACADLLARAAAAFKRKAKPSGLEAIAETMLNILPGDPEKVPKREYYTPLPSAETGLVVDVVAAFAVLDPMLADKASQHMLQWPAVYKFDEVLVPAVKKLVKKATTKKLAAVEILRNACMEHLRNRIAKELAPPADWTRPSSIHCECADCTELSTFLANPKRESWDFRAAEQRRRHVSSSINTNNCDLDCRTDKNGRPYGLVCTKNQASYERRVQQRQEDLDNLALLE